MGDKVVLSTKCHVCGGAVEACSWVNSTGKSFMSYFCASCGKSYGKVGGSVLWHELDVAIVVAENDPDGHGLKLSSRG